MGISHYLAMTAAEIAAAPALPDRLAYMACHFSPYGTGLTGCPEALPEKAMLILNDRIPFCGHDEYRIAELLQQWVQDLKCSCLLLDFQRADTPAALGQYLVSRLSVPIGIPPDFSPGLACPVFLPPAPPDQPLEAYLHPWTGREIWLEVTPECHRLTLDQQGACRNLLPPEDPEGFPFADSSLHCHYRTEVFPQSVEFTLQRTPDDMAHLLQSGETLGITKAVSLYQHVKKLPVK